MKKKDFIICFMLLLPAVAGIFIGGYGGGMITGISSAILFGATVGKIAAHKAIAKIDNTPDIRY